MEVSYDPVYGLASGYALSATTGSGQGQLEVEQTVDRGMSTRVEQETWTRRLLSGGLWTDLGDRSVTYTWGDGLLGVKRLNQNDPISFTYDALRRIDVVYQDNVYVTPLASPLETYAYDVAGNPTAASVRLSTAQGGGTLDYTYDNNPRFNEVTFRHDAAAGIMEWFDYDPLTSRLTGWTTVDTGAQPPATTTRTYAYDGAGRLREQGGHTPVVYRYDVDDQLVEEARGTAPNTSVVRRFEGWRWQQNGNVTTEQVLPMLRLSGPLATVVATEPDGHAVMTWTWNAATGAVVAESTDLVGAYGRDLADRSGQTPVGTPAWPLDGFHGAEPDAGGEIVHFGARHMLTRDGLWMQPEPLLYLGLTNGDLANPRAFGGLYAMGNSNAYEDQSGRFITPVFSPS